jgi:hypothetical protein
MKTKRHDSYIPLQNQISATHQNDTTYNYNNMKQIISRVVQEYNMNGKCNKDLMLSLITIYKYASLGFNIKLPTCIA